MMDSLPPQPQQGQSIPASSAPRPTSHSAGGSSAAAGGVSSQAAVASNSSDLSAKEKKEKEKFLMFTRVLMKYLEQRDKVKYLEAKTIIKDCYDKNKSGDPAYKSLTGSMKERLLPAVGIVYWKKAQHYFDFFVRQKQREKEQQKNDKPQSGSAQLSGAGKTIKPAERPDPNLFSLDDVKLPDLSQPLEVVAHPAQYGAAFRGLLNVNNDGSHSSSGVWAITHEHFSSDMTSRYHFGIEANNAAEDAQIMLDRMKASGEDKNDDRRISGKVGYGVSPVSVGHTTFPIDSTRYRGSFEIRNEAAELQIVLEKQIVLKFVKNKGGFYNVYGKGRNEMRVFDIVGTLILQTKSSGIIQLYRTYEPVPVTETGPDTVSNTSGNNCFAANTNDGAGNITTLGDEKSEVVNARLEKYTCGQQERKKDGLNVEGALLYFDQMKHVFEDQPQKYNGILGIIKVIQERTVDTVDVMKRVIQVFLGKNGLISGFNAYLSKGFKIELGGSEPVCVVPSLSSVRNQGSVPNESGAGNSDILSKDEGALKSWKGGLTTQEMKNAETMKASNSAIAYNGEKEEDDSGGLKKRKISTELENDSESNSKCKKSNATGVSNAAQISKAKQEIEAILSSLEAAENEHKEQSKELQLWREGKIQIREVVDAETGAMTLSTVANVPGNSSGEKVSGTELQKRGISNEVHDVPPKRSNLAQLVQIKQEKVTVQASLDDVKEDFEIMNETLTQQTLFTNEWQSRFDRVAELAIAAGVDRSLISKIRNEKLSV